MHVVILPSWYGNREQPGSGIFFKDQAVALAKIGCHVTILFVETRSLRSFSFKKFFSESHFQICENNSQGVFEYIIKGWNPLIQSHLGRELWIWLMLRLFCRYQKKYGKPDIIHVHSVLWAGVVANNIKNKFNIPYVITEHSSGFVLDEISPNLKPIFERVGVTASMFFAVSEMLANKISDYCNTIKIVILPNFVDTIFFSNVKPVSYLNRLEFNFFCLGNLNPNKGYDILLAAFAKTFKDNFNVHLNIGGQGELADILKEKTRVMGIEKQITFLGYLDRNQVREQFRSTDSFVLASRIETFGVVFIEAMACGIPVIATRCGGPEEFVTSECGYIVEKENVNQLAEALNNMIANRSQFDGSKIYDYILNNFDSGVLAKRLLTFYERCLD